MAEDEKFISRWARRKAQSRGDAGLEDDAEAPIAETAEPEAPVEDPDDHPAAGIDIDKLDYESDFTVFMHEKVPQALKRQALRRLWASNPILANVDGLNDYDDDFTDAATVVEGLKAAYDEACARLKAEEDAAAKADAAPGDDQDQDEDQDEEGTPVAEAPPADEAVDQAPTAAADEDLEDGTDEA